MWHINSDQFSAAAVFWAKPWNQLFCRGNEPNDGIWGFRENYTISRNALQNNCINLAV